MRQLLKKILDSYYPFIFVLVLVALNAFVFGYNVDTLLTKCFTVCEVEP